jgi:hypothetical protein
LTTDALSKGGTSIEVLSNQIKLEHDSCNCLTIRLKTEEGTLNTDSSLGSSRVQSNQTTDLSQSVISDVPFQIIEVILHQLLRQHHLSSFKNYDSSGISKEKEKELAIGHNKKMGILDSVFLLYRYYYCCKNLIN